MHLRPCILVPVFDNPQTIRAVISEILTITDSMVFVIDDGSKIPVKSLVEPHPRLTFFRHERNQGKGKALQTGFREALKCGFTHALTVDADGQHPIPELPKLLAKMEAHPWSLIIGMRNLEAAAAPRVSRFGRKFSNFWVQYETEIPVQDSQSGLRIYPLFHLQTMRFFSRKYDFEIEVLIRLLWRKVEVIEVPIQVSYDKATRVSHFKKGRDNIRISILNTILVFLSLIRGNLNPLESSLAVGAGILVGCTPFFGFHTAIIFAVCLLFRLNFPLAWVGTQVSIPPLAPLLSVTSIGLGKSFAQSIFIQWLLGSIILGTGLGTIGALVTYGVRTLLQGTPNKHRAWTGKMRGGKFGNWFLKQVLTYFGIRAAYACLYFIVPYFYFFAPSGRKGSSQYWACVYPDKSWVARQGLVLRHYFEFGRVLLDRLYSQLCAGAPIQTHSSGAEHILDHVQRGKGVILLSAHVGSWTLAAHHMRFKREGLEFHTVEYSAEKQQGQRSKDSVTGIFANLQSHAVLDVHSALQAGKPMGMMGDRPRSRRLELVPFLGKLAVIDSTPFRLAATLHIPVLFTFGFRESNGVYRFYSEAPRNYAFNESEDKSVQTYKWAAEFALVLEKHVRMYSLQWFNFYPFFSTAVDF